jgi:hypothetical protein
MRGRDASSRGAYQGDEGSRVGERMFTRNIMPVLKPRREVAEGREGVTKSFRDLPEALRDATASARRIAKPFAAGRELESIRRLVCVPQTDARPPHVMPNWLRLRVE